MMAALAVILSCLLATTPFTDTERRRIAGLSGSLESTPDTTNKVWNDPAAALLGQRLFFDTGFSLNDQVSCATCHDPATGFADGKPLPTGLAKGSRHTPSLLNVAGQRWFFWDGRADTLWSQALHPFERAEEFGSNRLAVLHRVHDDPVLRREYESVFGPMPPLDDHVRFPSDASPDAERDSTVSTAWEAMSKADQQACNRAFSNLGKAIAAYEHRLVPPPSRFDEFVTAMLADDSEAMAEYPEDARRGLRLFIGEAGCRQCHFGPLLSDLEFHNTGIPPGHGGLPKDAGRWEGIKLLQANPFRASGQFSDDQESIRALSTDSLARNSELWGAFRTPSLRNLNQTAPYMHQGQFESLREVLVFYNTLEEMVVLDHHQETVLQPLGFTENQLDDLESFLMTLSSPELAPELTRKPGVEPTGSSTEKQD
ncbi:MAG: hypothetical protein CMJ40_05805 [Phycisphaerae bacterium]|nr:hypothetical protein [Phycisphaerae bacterium]